MGVSDPMFPDHGERLNAYKLIGDRVRLSARTVRDAFARRPVTLQTALTLARLLRIDVAAFRIILDGRGRSPKDGVAKRRKRPKKVAESRGKP